MKKTVFFVSVIFIWISLFASVVSAADKDKALNAIVNTKTSLDNLLRKGADGSEYKDDIIVAKNYLNWAETEFNKGLGIMGGLKDEAEPVILHYTSMADLTIAIVAARLEKANLLKEKEDVEKNTELVKSRIKIFDDKNREIASLQSENQKMKSDLNGVIAQKGVEFVQVQSKLNASDKARELFAGLSQIGLMTRISLQGATVIIPRNSLIKIGRKGPELAPGADRVAGDIAALSAKNPEYKVAIRVFGYGRPAKNEDAKATGMMAKKIKDLLVEKGKMDASTLDADGAGTGSAIYPKTSGDANRRVEITFTRK